MIKHIMQKNHVDCGFAVAAMLSGATYRKAKKSDPCPQKTIGLSVSDFVETVTACSGKQWRVIIPKKRIALIESAWIVPNFGALIIRDKGKVYGHWVAIKNGLIHDPERKRGISIARYARRHWQLIRIVVPIQTL